jgi:hypothetical protein
MFFTKEGPTYEYKNISLGKITPSISKSFKNAVYENFNTVVL